MTLVGAAAGAAEPPESPTHLSSASSTFVSNEDPDAMIAFAEATTCRRRVLLGYFGERLEEGFGDSGQYSLLGAIPGDHAGQGNHCAQSNDVCHDFTTDIVLGGVNDVELGYLEITLRLILHQVGVDQEGRALDHMQSYIPQ